MAESKNFYNHPIRRNLRYRCQETADLLSLAVFHAHKYAKICPVAGIGFADAPSLV